MSSRDGKHEQLRNYFNVEGRYILRINRVVNFLRDRRILFAVGGVVASAFAKAQPIGCA